MINDKIQNQNAGDNSSNVQAQVINVNGLSYSEVREIVNDLFAMNFTKMKEEAWQIARSRAEDFLIDFLSKTKNNTNILNEFRNPGMQDAFYNAQKEFAKVGDFPLKETLVNLLIKRASVNQRDMMQLVLTEALDVAPKLTMQQMDILTLCFLIKNTIALGLKDLNGFIHSFENGICPFVESVSSNHNQYSYLEYHGCGSVRNQGIARMPALESTLLDSYIGYLNNGFTKEDLNEEFGQINICAKLIIPCHHNSEKLQIAAINYQDLDEKLVRFSVENDSRIHYRRLLENNQMNSTQIRNFLCEKIPSLFHLFTTWNNSNIQHFNMSPVGIAIAAANYERKVGDVLNLPDWVN